MSVRSTSIKLALSCEEHCKVKANSNLKQFPVFFFNLIKKSREETKAAGQSQMVPKH
jgi:hypothetical protein